VAGVERYGLTQSGLQETARLPGPRAAAGRFRWRPRAAPTAAKMISGIFIFNHKGEVLIYRLYREDIKCVGGARRGARARRAC